jgi:hypothetical protein
VAGENGSVSARFKLAFAASANEHALCSGDGESERGAGALGMAGNVPRSALLRPKGTGASHCSESSVELLCASAAADQFAP